MSQQTPNQHPLKNASQQKHTVQNRTTPPKTASGGPRPASGSAAPKNALRSGKTAPPARASSQKTSGQASGKKQSESVSIFRKGETAGSAAVSSLVKALIYIMAILVVAGVVSYLGITWVNDAFALVKEDTPIEVTIGEGISIKELGNILHDNGVISHPKIFDLYTKIKDNRPDLVSGTYTVSPSMDYDELVNTFAKKVTTTRTTVIVTIPEGFSVDQIIDRLTNKYHLSSEAELVDAIQHYDFDFWFVKELDGKIPAGRKYRLEGYLYPDTYYYYSDASADTILKKMLANFDKQMKDTFKKVDVEGETYVDKIHTLCEKQGFTFDEIVTIASIVQMEAKYELDYATTASVFYNRIKKPNAETGGKLESDATINYVLTEKKIDLTEEELNIDSPYNTRRYEGLPPGPITNPTFLSINDTFFHDNSSYYYFVTKADGFNLFAKNYKAHKANVEAVKASEDED